MGRAPYSTAEWGVEGFCELLAKAPSTGTGRAVPFQCITISQKVLRSREPQSAHLWTYSVPPSLNRLYGPSHPAFWRWLSDTYCCTHARVIALAKANHARPSSGRHYGNSSLNLRYHWAQNAMAKNRPRRPSQRPSGEEVYAG